jgi:hypothetical protein
MHQDLLAWCFPEVLHNILDITGQEIEINSSTIKPSAYLSRNLQMSWNNFRKNGLLGMVWQLLVVLMLGRDNEQQTFRSNGLCINIGESFVSISWISICWNDNICDFSCERLLCSSSLIRDFSITSAINFALPAIICASLVGLLMVCDMVSAKFFNQVFKLVRSFRFSNYASIF